MTRRSVDLPQPLGPMQRHELAGGRRQVDAVEREEPAAVTRSGTRRPHRSGGARRSWQRLGRHDRPGERPQDRRGRRIQRDVRLEQPRRRSARARRAARSGGRSGSSPRWRSRCRGAPRCRRRRGSREPTTAVSRTAGTATVKPVTSALMRFHDVAPGRAAADPHLGRRGRRRPASGVGDVADRERRGLEDRAGEVAAAVAERQAGEDAAGASGPRAASARRRGTAGRRGRRRRAASRRPPRGGPRSSTVAAQDAVAIPVERAAGRRHRRPDAVPAGQRGRGDERARARRPARSQ